MQRNSLKRRKLNMENVLAREPQFTTSCFILVYINDLSRHLSNAKIFSDETSLFSNIIDVMILFKSTIMCKNIEKNDQFYRNVAFLMFTEMVNFRPQNTKAASKLKIIPRTGH